MKLNKAQTIFMLGIAGVGMQGLAWLLKEQGKDVRGCDLQLSEQVMNRFRTLAEPQAKPLLHDTDLMIYTDAVVETHPLLNYAREHNISSLPYHEALGQFAQQYMTIAVTGTHGKSSTTAFLAHILIENNCDPTVLVGATVSGWPGDNARAGNGTYFVVEADEYRKHFLTLNPTHTIITSIDFDHPDYFNDLADVACAYDEFLQNMQQNSIVVTSDNVIEKHPGLSWPSNTDVIDKQYIEKIPNPLPGDHMKHNAALATRTAELLGIDHNGAIRALESFPGLGRRMEELGTYDSMKIISDYGHHPAEITATLKAAREHYPGKSILIMFEAHMVERLTTFFEQFIDALSQADGILIYPPFSPAGRENIEASELTRKLATQLNKRGKESQVIEAAEGLAAALHAVSNQYDIALAFTAGRLDQELRKLTI